MNRPLEYKMRLNFRISNLKIYDFTADLKKKPRLLLVLFSIAHLVILSIFLLDDFFKQGMLNAKDFWPKIEHFPR